MKTETEILKAQNKILETALIDLIDYHHHIGNRDCPLSLNEIHNKLYSIAANGLKESVLVTEEKIEGFDMFNIMPLLSEIKITK